MFFSDGFVEDTPEGGVVEVAGETGEEGLV